MSGLGVQGGLGQQNQVLPRGDVQLEDVEPDLLHVIVFCDDVMLNVVLQGQAFMLALGLVTNVGVLWSMPIIMPWCQGCPMMEREHGLGDVVLSSKDSFVYAGAIVNDQPMISSFTALAKEPGVLAGREHGAWARPLVSEPIRVFKNTICRNYKLKHRSC